MKRRVLTTWPDFTAAGESHATQDVTDGFWTAFCGVRVLEPAPAGLLAPSCEDCRLWVIDS